MPAIQSEHVSIGSPVSELPPSASEQNGPPAALEVMILWGEQSVLHVEHLAPARSLYVGEASAEVDFVIGRESLGVDRLPIVLCAEGEVRVVFGRGARGEIRYANQTIALEELEQQGRLAPVAELAEARQYVLPAGAEACVRHGEFVFLVRRQHAVRWTGVRGREPSLRRHGWTLGSTTLHAALLLAFNLLPPPSSALSIDRLDADPRWSRYALELPAPQPETPKWLEERTPAADGGGGKPTSGPPGRSGDPTHAKTPRRRADRGDASQSSASSEPTNPAEDGILGILRRSANGSSSIFNAQHAAGADPLAALGDLISASQGPSWGRGGIAMIGTGVGGGGDGSGTRGVGGLGTRGVGGGDGSGHGRGYGSGAGGLGGRDARVPHLRPQPPEVHGSLSKDAIRRTINRHLNEMRYCYESALTTRPELEGRVTMKFIIAPSGLVQVATIQESALAHAGVETCMTRALQRWAFPAPAGGGLVVVTYPFVLSRTGG
jgi:hypothetical protein